MALDNEPKTFKESMSSGELTYWKEVANTMIESILSNDISEFVDLPLGNKPLVSNWIFKSKMKANGTIDKYKARPVVNAYKQ